LKTSFERLQKAAASCGLILVPNLPGSFEHDGPGNVGKYTAATGEVEVSPGSEDDERLQCLLRTLASAEQIEAEVEELTKPEGVQEPVKAQS